MWRCATARGQSSSPNPNIPNCPGTSLVAQKVRYGEWHVLIESIASLCHVEHHRILLGLSLGLGLLPGVRPAKFRVLRLELGFQGCRVSSPFLGLGPLPGGRPAKFGVLGFRVLGSRGVGSWGLGV